MKTTKKNLQGEERKELILNEACKLFAELGYEKASTKKLAEAADCSEALIYKYFESKSEIMETLLEEWIEDQNKQIKLDIVDNSAIVTFRKHYESFLSTEKRGYTNSPVRQHLLEALNSTPLYRRRVEEIFLNGTDMMRDTIIPIVEFGQKNGEIKSGDAAVMANLFTAYMVGAKEIAKNFPTRFQPIPFEELVNFIFM